MELHQLHDVDRPELPELLKIRIQLCLHRQQVLSILKVTQLKARTLAVPERIEPVIARLLHRNLVDCRQSDRITREVNHSVFVMRFDEVDLSALLHPRLSLVSAFCLKCECFE